MRLLGLSMQVLICIAVAACHAAANIEGDALYAFRRQLQDPMNVLQSWDPTLVNPCTWFHVTCDSNNHVIRLDLGNAGLQGALVPQLGRLTHLQYLELYKNNIVGSIPEELGNLRSLISLDLYDNNLSGALPASLANLQSLRVLRLNGNRLTGKIPAQYTRLSSLKMLDLSDNDLSGTIPTSGSFYKFGLRSFLNNPRLDGPQLRVKRGSISYNLGS